VVNGYDYDVFGALRDSSGSQDNDFTFAGEQVDGSTGLQYLRARYYDADTGRFVSRDARPGSKWYPPGTNRYVYSLNNPTRLVDPSGHGGIDSASTMCDQPNVGLGCEGGGPPPPVTGEQIAGAGSGAALIGIAIYIQRLVDYVAEQVAAYLDSEEPGGYEGKDSGEIKASDLKRVPNSVIGRIGTEEVHDMKGGSPGTKDLYYDPKTGLIYVVPKGGDQVPEPTGRNIKEFE
jgi:RHS repeat-associated protein